MYENALRIELLKQGLEVKQQVPINVYYEGQIVGDYYADLWVEDRLIIELKAIQQLTKKHEVQLVNYLTATGIDNGLLLPYFCTKTCKQRRFLFILNTYMQTEGISNPILGID